MLDTYLGSNMYDRRLGLQPKLERVRVRVFRLRVELWSLQ
jgi:hypothetical protein